MKKIPWNRFTKHLVVFVFLGLISAAYFYSRFFLIPLVFFFIPLEHRIERDYRSTRTKCKRCRRWKPEDEFDGTFCVECVRQENEEKERKAELMRRPRDTGYSMADIGKLPPKPPFEIHHQHRHFVAN